MTCATDGCAGDAGCGGYADTLVVNGVNLNGEDGVNRVYGIRWNVNAVRGATGVNGNRCKRCNRCKGCNRCNDLTGVNGVTGVIKIRGH